MYNRDYKIHGRDQYYHIFNRGNNKRNIFLDDQDFGFFLLRLKQNLFPTAELIQQGRIQPLPANSFSLLSYCLMPNHFHFLLRQDADVPPSKLLLKVCTSYSMYFNKKYQRVGHLFQDQYKQILVDNEDYLLWLSVYIHQNPKVAELVNNLVEYKWSSYPQFIREIGGLCNPSIILEFLDSGPQETPVSVYQKLVESSFEIIKEKKDLEKLLLDHTF